MAEAEIDEVAAALSVDAETIRGRVAELHEFNPMLGHRGVRLAISYPEIAEMQARAIFEAAAEVGAAHRHAADPGSDGAARRDHGPSSIWCAARIVPVAEEVEAETGTQDRLSRRHHDRTAARRLAGRRHRRDGRVLLLRHQ